MAMQVVVDCTQNHDTQVLDSVDLPLTKIVSYVLI